VSNHAGATTDVAQAGRIEGYDLARALAILGMVVVHFALVMSSERADEGGWASKLIQLLDGRAAATFMVLAGVGITLGRSTGLDIMCLIGTRDTPRRSQLSGLGAHTLAHAPEMLSPAPRRGAS